MSNLKAIILVGGPQKGTRFRPLSLDCPKPLFPIAGYPMIEHHIERLSQVPELKEVLLVGFYQADQLSEFIAYAHATYGVSIRYLQEFTSLGTAGGIYHFRDQILMGNPDALFVINGDVCGDLPLAGMVESLRERPKACCIILSTEATRDQSLNYGCLVVDRNSTEVLHYVEKPTTFLSAMVNCGVYLFTPAIFQHLTTVFQRKIANSLEYSENLEAPETLWFENELFPQLASSKTFFAHHTSQWWSQLKSAATAIYANCHCLALYRRAHPERLAPSKGDSYVIIGDVYIHPTAKVHQSAVLGPNVSIGKNVVVGAGVRIKESIILPGAILQDHCCIMFSIVGWNSTVGMWSRVEGTPIGPNPNVPFAKLESKPLFNKDGRLNPSITILGGKVQIPNEIVVLNTIVLPHKELTGSFKNQIIL